MERNIISIQGSTDEESWLKFEKDFEKFKNAQYGINISCIGGPIKYANMIIEKMKQNPPCSSDGGAFIASSGLYIYLQGFKRDCLTESDFLIHRHRDPETNFFLPEIKGLELESFKMVSERTNLTIEQVIKFANANNGDGTKFRGKEVVDLGFAHNIVRY